MIRLPFNTAYYDTKEDCDGIRVDNEDVICLQTQYSGFYNLVVCLFSNMCGAVCLL